MVGNEFVIGIVRNPYRENELTTVVGHEFGDSPGFYQFYSTDGMIHFRKRPDRFDDVHTISFNVFQALKTKV